MKFQWLFEFSKKKCPYLLGIGFCKVQGASFCHSKGAVFLVWPLFRIVSAYILFSFFFFFFFLDFKVFSLFSKVKGFVLLNKFCHLFVKGFRRNIKAPTGKLGIKVCLCLAINHPFKSSLIKAFLGNLRISLAIFRHLSYLFIKISFLRGK